LKSGLRAEDAASHLGFMARCPLAFGAATP
jgi:hypothetical protein